MIKKTVLALFVIGYAIVGSLRGQDCNKFQKEIIQYKKETTKSCKEYAVSLTTWVGLRNNILHLQKETELRKQLLIPSGDPVSLNRIGLISNNKLFGFSDSAVFTYFQPRTNLRFILSYETVSMQNDYTSKKGGWGFSAGFGTYNHQLNLKYFDAIYSYKVIEEYNLIGWSIPVFIQKTFPKSNTFFLGVQYNRVNNVRLKTNLESAEGIYIKSHERNLRSYEIKSVMGFIVGGSVNLSKISKDLFKNSDIAIAAELSFSKPNFVTYSDGHHKNDAIAINEIISVIDYSGYGILDYPIKLNVYANMKFYTAGTVSLIIPLKPLLVNW